MGKCSEGLKKGYCCYAQPKLQGFANTKQKGGVETITEVSKND